MFNISLVGNISSCFQNKYVIGNQEKLCLKFWLFVPSDQKDESGNRKTILVSCKAWNHIARYILQGYAKGNTYWVNGEFDNTYSWKNKDEYESKSDATHLTLTVNKIILIKKASVISDEFVNKQISQPINTNISTEIKNAPSDEEIEELLKEFELEHYGNQNN